MKLFRHGFSLLICSGLIVWNSTAPSYSQGTNSTDQAPAKMTDQSPTQTTDPTFAKPTERPPGKTPEQATDKTPGAPNGTAPTKGVAPTGEAPKSFAPEAPAAKTTEQTTPQSTDQWQVLSPSPDYSVSMPTPYKVSKDKESLSISTIYTAATPKGTAYVFADVQTLVALSPEQEELFFKNVIAGFLKAMQGAGDTKDVEVSKPTDLNIQGHSAKSFDLKRGPLAGKAIFILANGRVVFLNALTLDSSDKAPDNFINSIKFHELLNYLPVMIENGLTRWPKSKMPLKVAIIDGSKVPDYRESYLGILKQAFADWTAATDGRVTFTYIDNPDDCDISVSFTDTNAHFAQIRDLGETLFMADGNNLVHANISLLTRRMDGSKEISDNLARRLDLHEIGHALGLNTHSINPHDVMFSTMLGGDELVPYQLTDRDKNTLIALYDADDETVAAHKVIAQKQIGTDSNATPLARSMRLNAQAADAITAQNLVLARQLLEEAHRLDDSNPVVNANLGAVLARAGWKAYKDGHITDSENLFERALPLLRHSPVRSNYREILKVYGEVLRAAHKDKDADRVEAELSTLTKN
jgi:predicted Zn-dependent protease